MVAVAKQALPPGRRDFEVYRLVAVEGKSTREAARVLHLSQTRVMQINARVFEWMAKNTPPQADVSKEQQLRASESLAVQRMEHVYAECLDAWKQSKGDERMCRSSLTGEATTTSRSSQGNVRYLQQAIRAAKELARFPLGLAPMGAEDEGDDAGTETSVAETPLSTRMPAASGACPPGVDCSPAAANEAMDADAESDEVDEEAELATTSADERSGRRLRLHPAACEFAPVHPGLLKSIAEPSKATLALPASNRRQRRARQRELERARKKLRRAAQ